jgi:probable HAF family extracellular repeat protein
MDSQQGVRRGEIISKSPINRRSFLAGVTGAAAGFLTGIPVLAGKPGGGGLPPLRWKAVPIDFASPNLFVAGMNNQGDLVGSQSSLFADGNFFFEHNGDGTGQFSHALGGPNDVNDVGQYSFDDNADVGRYNPIDGSVTVVNNVNGPYYRIALNNHGDMVFSRDPLQGEQGMSTILYTDVAGPQVVANGVFFHTFALNDYDEFCGFVTPGNPWSLSSERACRYSPGNGVVALSNLPSAGFDINSDGDVCGEYWSGVVSLGRQHAFLHTDAGGLLDLGTLGGAFSTAKSLTRPDANGNPYVVGWSTASSKNGSPNLPFIYHASFGMVDLTKLIDFTKSPGVPQGTLFAPGFINDSLEICASTNNNLGVCLLIPL